MFALGIATAAPRALAVDYTYIFTASPGQSTEFNGSTVEINVNYKQTEFPDSVIDWNILDTALPYNVTPGSPINPDTSTLIDNNISSASASSWSGDFDGGSVVDFYCENYTTANSGMVGDYVEGQTDIPSECAYGNWAPESDPPSASSSVPDAGSTLALLAAATLAIGAVRRLMNIKADLR